MDESSPETSFASLTRALALAKSPLEDGVLSDTGCVEFAIGWLLSGGAADKPDVRSALRRAGLILSPNLRERKKGKR